MPAFRKEELPTAYRPAHYYQKGETALILGSILFGLIAGVIAAIVALSAGLGVAMAFLTYVLCGFTGMVVTLGFAFLRPARMNAPVLVME